MTRWPKAAPPSPCTAIADRLGEHGLLGDGDDAWPSRRPSTPGRRPGPPGVPALPSRASSRPTVSTVTPSGALDVDLHAVPVGDGGAVVQAAQPLQRGEPPLLLAAVRDREVRHVEGRGRAHARGDGRLGGHRDRAGGGGPHRDVLSLSHGCRRARFPASENLLAVSGRRAS